MFFSLDPDDYRDPKSCSLSNGTTIYSNHSLAQDCSCVAPFAAEPDFAGPGIIASFCFLSWLTIFVAGVPAFYSVRHSWRTAAKPHRIWNFTCHVLQLRITQKDDVSGQSVVQHCRTESSGSAITDASGHDDKEDTTMARPDMQPPHPQPRTRTQTIVEPRPVALAKAVLVSLTDIQAVTGLAYIITGMCQIQRISFYHEQFVTNLWWLTLNSLWVSRIDYNENVPQMESWRFQIRRLIILSSVSISAVFQAIVAIREDSYWDPTESGKCYVGSSLGSNFAGNMLWLVGTALYAFILVLGSFRWSRRVFDEQVLSRIEPSLAIMWGWAHGSIIDFKEYRRSPSHTSEPFLMRVALVLFLSLRMLCYSLAFLTWWCTIQFLAVWSSGVGSHVVEMLVYTGFAVESTVWVILLKLENKVLVQGPENRWTFGQMLPVTLFVLVALAGMDAAATIPERRHSAEDAEAG